MLISPAYAQAAQTSPNPLMQFAPIVLIFVIFYFLLIRPQMTARKKHQEMVSNVRRGDVVVTAGGIVGKVTKVLEGDEIMVELADKVAVRVVKSTLSDVRTKPAPLSAEDKSREKHEHARKISFSQSDWRSLYGFKQGEKPTKNELQKRYNEQVKRHHPDRGGDPNQFQKFKEAYDQGLKEIENSYKES
jgi:preprotein translocase subunit YajC